MLPSALCAAESTGLPVTALVHTLYAPIASAAFDSMSMMGGVRLINTLRGDLGLPPVERITDLLDRTARVFATAPLALDPAPAAVAANVRYVGPLLEAPGADARWAPPAGDGPLIVISLGTTPMDEAPVLQRVLDAVSEMPVRAVATVGDHVDGAVFAVPPNARVERYVRHAVMLAHADLFVGHAGLGGILAAIASGVPMICLPLGRDQPMNAARVEAIGAGRTLPPDSDAEALRAAIASVLGDANYRRAARSIAKDIAASMERQLAVSELEGLLST
jgi:MGT family glycosyltransferase